MKNGIKKIRIKNYQSIKDADIELGDITVITGRTDSGKSAFFRAVKAVVDNESGDEFTTAGEKRTVVDIDNIRWIQSENENSYEIDGKRWDKCGKSVPDDVKKELNMGEFEFGKDVKYFLNFSGQLDPSFIVQGNPADNAKVIGSISNIHTVYNGLREAEKDTKNTKHTITDSQEQLQVIQKQLEIEAKKFDVFTQYHNQLKEIYIKSKEIDEKFIKLQDLKSICLKFNAEYSKCIAENKRYKGIDFNSIYARIDEIIAIRGIKDRLLLVNKGLNAIKAIVATHEAINIYKGFDTIEIIESLLKLKLKASELNGHIKSEATLSGEIAHRMGELKRAMDKYEVCDVCGADKKDWKINV